MEAKERIKTAYEYLQKIGAVRTQIDVAERMSTKKQSVNQAFNGNKSYLTKNFILKFNNAFDNIFNVDWLMEEKGEMLRNHNTQIVGDINNSSVFGVNVNGNGIQITPSSYDALIDVIQRQQHEIQKFQEQIDRLLTLLEKKYE